VVWRRLGDVFAVRLGDGVSGSAVASRTEGKAEECFSCSVRLLVPRSMVSEASRGGELAVLLLLAACSWSLRSVCCSG
jgi:hypothetical protein